RVPFREGAHGGDDELRLRAGFLEVESLPGFQRLRHRRLVVCALQDFQDAVAMVRKIRVQADPAPIAALIGAGDLVPQFGWLRAVDGEMAIAAARMSTPTRCDCAERTRQISAAANAEAATLACMAVPTANDDGNTGSAPVKSTLGRTLLS